MKIGRNLQAVIEVKDVPKESVREALGWDDETLERVLADQLSPGISELLRLATFLGVGRRLHRYLLCLYGVVGILPDVGRHLFH